MAHVKTKFYKLKLIFKTCWSKIPWITKAFSM